MVEARIGVRCMKRAHGDTTRTAALTRERFCFRQLVVRNEKSRSWGPWLHDVIAMGQKLTAMPLSSRRGGSRSGLLGVTLLPPWYDPHLVQTNDDHDCDRRHKKSASDDDLINEGIIVVG